MKLYVLLSLSVMCVPSFLMGTSCKSEYLKFELNDALEVTGYASKNMEFLVPAKAFMGKVITQVVPLNVEDGDAITAGFEKAREESNELCVPYTLNGKSFLSIIKYKKDKSVFSVKVKQLKD